MPYFDESVGHQAADGGGNVWAGPNVKESSVGGDVGQIPDGVPLYDDGRGRRSSKEDMGLGYGATGATANEVMQGVRHELAHERDERQSPSYGLYD